METSASLSRKLSTLSDTEQFANSIASAFDEPLTIALNGTLGAGKTQLARYLCVALGVPAELVTSPTYVLLQRYRGQRFEIYHFDFYRLENTQQVWDLGFDELQESNSLLLIEWADKFPETLPMNRLDVHLSIENSDAVQASRHIHLTAHGVTAQRLLSRVLKF